MCDSESQAFSIFLGKKKINRYAAGTLLKASFITFHNFASTAGDSALVVSHCLNRLIDCVVVSTQSKGNKQVCLSISIRRLPS